MNTVTLKEITENHEKLHRLNMIRTILCEAYSYVSDVLERVSDDFDDCEDFEDYVTESIIKAANESIELLKKYL